MFISDRRTTADAIRNVPTTRLRGATRRQRRIYSNNGNDRYPSTTVFAIVARTIRAT